MYKIYALVVLSSTLTDVRSQSKNATLMKETSNSTADVTNLESTSTECFYFCPTWTSITVLTVIAMMLCCFCAVMTQHNQREIWYVVERNRLPGPTPDPLTAQPITNS